MPPPRGSGPTKRRSEGESGPRAGAPSAVSEEDEKSSWKLAAMGVVRRERRERVARRALVVLRRPPSSPSCRRPARPPIRPPRAGALRTGPRGARRRRRKSVWRRAPCPAGGGRGAARVLGAARATTRAARPGAPRRHWARIGAACPRAVDAIVRVEARVRSRGDGCARRRAGRVERRDPERRTSTSLKSRQPRNARTRVWAVRRMRAGRVDRRATVEFERGETDREARGHGREPSRGPADHRAKHPRVWRSARSWCDFPSRARPSCRSPGGRRRDHSSGAPTPPDRAFSLFRRERDLARHVHLQEGEGGADAVDRDAAAGALPGRRRGPTTTTSCLFFFLVF